MRSSSSALRRDVRVERHRPDAEPLGDPPHREGRRGPRRRPARSPRATIASTSCPAWAPASARAPSPHSRSRLRSRSPRPGYSGAIASMMPPCNLRTAYGIMPANGVWRTEWRSERWLRATPGGPRERPRQTIREDRRARRVRPRGPARQRSAACSGRTGRARRRRSGSWQRSSGRMAGAPRWPASTSSARPARCGAGSGWSARTPALDEVAERTAEPGDVRAAVPPRARRRAAAGGRAARALRPRGCRRQAGQAVLRRDAPAARPRGEPDPRARPSCSSTSRRPAWIRAAATRSGPRSARSSRDGTTVLLTTQYLDEADQLADRICVIDRGRVIADGYARRAQGARRRRPPRVRRARRDDARGRGGDRRPGRRRARPTSTPTTAGSARRSATAWRR